MSGARHKQKGSRREREIVERLKKVGVPAQRVPLSGAALGLFSGDVSFNVLEKGRTAEVKARANGEGWKTIKEWLGKNDALFLIEDRSEPLVVLPWAFFEELIYAGPSLLSVPDAADDSDPEVPEPQEAVS